MFPYSSLYEILNVPESASSDEIKSSFRKLAHIYHPDKNNNSTESETEFKILNNAYSVLSDSLKRSEYDNYLKTSSVLKNRKKQPRGINEGIPEIAGGPFTSIKKIFNHLNYLLWDIEDLLRRQEGVDWDLEFSGKPLWQYILKILTFIDQWVLDPSGYRDYFMEARKMGKVNITEYIFESFRPGNTEHRPFFDINDYFYDVRKRVDKFMHAAKIGDLVKTVPDSGIRIIDCILESQNLAVHYLSYISKVLKSETDVIPSFNHSYSCFGKL
jgi:curved DNA-binding protein CbpA